MRRLFVGTLVGGVLIIAPLSASAVAEEGATPTTLQVETSTVERDVTTVVSEEVDTPNVDDNDDDESDKTGLWGLLGLLGLAGLAGLKRNKRDVDTVPPSFTTTAPPGAGGATARKP